jgi:iron complex transport system substrate-binding protein
MKDAPRRRAAARSVALAALAALLAHGCRGPGSAPSRPEGVVLDGLGREVPMPRAPRRIVSLAPSVTETLFALGFGDRLAGVSDFCFLPPGTAPIARVGGLLNPSLESIAALHPDILVATTSGNDPGLAAQAAALGLPLYTLHTPDVERTLQAIARLGEALGAPDRGRTLALVLNRRLQATAARVAGRRRPLVLYVVWADPLVVPGGPSLVTDALRRAGGVSVTAEATAAWPTFSLESVIGRAPEVILTTPKNAGLARKLASDPAWSGVPAVRSGSIHVVSDAIERPGPGVVRAIEEVARILHPEAFEPEKE